MPRQPLVIAGAGIAGLALAVGLSRDGQDCVVLDERPALDSLGGAITLWPNALAALDALGVGDDVRAAGRAVDAGSIRTAGDILLRRLDPERTVAALGGPLLAVRRGVLIDLLNQRARVADRRFGVAARGYRQDAAGVTVLTDDGDIRGSALVGADGYRSAIARTIEPGLGERYAGYPAWRGLARVGGLLPAQFWGRRQEFGVVPLDDETTYWYATLHEPAGGSAAEEIAHLRSAFAAWPTPVRTVLHADQEMPVSRNDVMDRAVPRRWTDGRVTLIGDAAHAMRPHLGQGGCQALMDAAALVGSLRTEPDPADAFTAYERVRRRPAVRAVRLSRSAGRAINAPAGLHRVARLLPEAALLRGLARVAAAPTR